MTPVSMQAAMYLRFVHTAPVDGLDARQGFLAAAYVLSRSTGLDEWSHRELIGHLNWFENNLALPDRFNRSKSKGAWHRETKGLSWFKPEAVDHIDRAFALVGLLTLNDIPIDTLRSNRIGYVVYEDDYQIVAEPFADTPR